MIGFLLCCCSCFVFVAVVVVFVTFFSLEGRGVGGWDDQYFCYLQSLNQALTVVVGLNASQPGLFLEANIIFWKDN